MKKREKLTAGECLILAAALVTGAALLAAAFFLKSERPGPLYDTQVKAARQMQECMDAVRAEKIRRNIAIPTEDIFDTGLIGEAFNMTTSTAGELGAKRTTADPDMAALIVKMLDEAGLSEGDVLACGFSGSFPALNIAVICACDAMGVRPVYIASVGSSTWGANNPGFTSPEMLVMLYESGLIKEPPALITPGGGDDAGRVPDEEAFAQIWERVVSLGYPVMIEENFSDNTAARKELYDGEGASAFLASGGNVTSLGKNMVIDLVGQGLIREKITSVNKDSGLLELFLYENRPAMLLLNIRQLVSDYGLPFDPVSHPAPGESPVYSEIVYPYGIIVICLAAEALLLVLFKHLKKSNDHT